MAKASMFLVWGGVFGFLGIVIGAFGAHGIKSRVTPELLVIFETGVKYQMYHALALIAIGVLLQRVQIPMLATSGWLMIVGTLIFSGSLYVLVLTGVRTWGAVTPIGGLCFLGGWFLFIISFLKK